MTKTFKQALSLPPDERSFLVTKLVQSLNDDDQQELSPETRAELDRREKEIESGIALTYSSDEVHAEIEKRLRQLRDERN